MVVVVGGLRAARDDELSGHRSLAGAALPLGHLDENRAHLRGVSGRLRFDPQVPLPVYLGFGLCPT